MTTPIEHRAFCTGDHIGTLCASEGLGIVEGPASIAVLVFQAIDDPRPSLHIEFRSGWPALGTFGLLDVKTVMSMANAVELRDALSELIERAS